MSTQADDKLEQLIAAHRDIYISLLHLCEALAPAEWGVETGCPGWTVRDVFAHVVGLESVLAGDPEPDHEPSEDPAHVQNEFGRYMERHVAARRSLPIADLLLEARDVFSRRLGQVELIDELETEVTGPMGSRNPAYRALPIRVFDMWAHEQDIRRAVGQPGHLEGPAAEVTFGRILKGIARALGGDATISGTLELAVTGAQSRVVAIELDPGELSSAGRHHDPDVRIALPFEDLVARSCGRSDAPGADLVLIEGDAELGARILDRLAITP